MWSISFQVRLSLEDHATMWWCECWKRVPEVTWRFPDAGFTRPSPLAHLNKLVNLGNMYESMKILGSMALSLL